MLFACSPSSPHHCLLPPKPPSKALSPTRPRANRHPETTSSLYDSRRACRRAPAARPTARAASPSPFPDPGGVHLVRVTHDKANYFQPVQPGTDTIDVDVYTAEPKVEGITGEADVMRLQTDPGGQNLNVVENFFVKNDSTPPKTQFSQSPFEFFLPEGALIEGSAALGPGGMPVRSAPVPMGDPNHYTFIFPIRPGETRFQVTYKLPYKGSLTFTPKPGMITDTIAVMMPKSMIFKAANSAPYTSVTEETTAQTYVARNVSPSQPLGFTVSGTGQLPRDDNAPTTDQNGSAQAAAGNGPVTSANDTRPGIGLNNPIDPEGTNDPWSKYKWWILGGLGLVLAAGAGFMLKAPTSKPTGSAPLSTVDAAGIPYATSAPASDRSPLCAQGRVVRPGNRSTAGHGH